MQAVWEIEQQRLKSALIEEDAPHFTLEEEAGSSSAVPLKRIGGVDISFVKDSDDACASLVVLDYPSLNVIYQDFAHVTMTVPYIPGFLAFREAGFLMDRLATLKAGHPELMPQVIMVDGNGILHPKGFGLASHLGVLADIPTIGIGKTFLHVDGLTQDRVKGLAKEHCSKGGDSVVLKGDSGREWGSALIATDGSTNPIYVSVGHRISLDSAVRITRAVCVHRVPEPVRQADLRSRDALRKKPS